MGLDTRAPHHFISGGELLVSMTTPGVIADEVWAGYLHAVAEDKPRHCVMLCMGPIAADAGQRRRFTQAVMRARSSVLVVTDNRVTRGWAMAVAWFGAKLDVRSWHELARAVDMLEIEPQVRQRLYRDALRFHDERRDLDG